MKRGTQLLRRPPKRRREVSNFHDILAQIQHSGSIYFVKSLPKAAIQTLKSKRTATLMLPAQFVQENGDKTEQSVILRAHSSRGSSARLSLVQLRVSARSRGAGNIRIGGGLYAAIAGNRLREGDSLVFVPQEDARLEFEVYTFRGTREFPLFPNEGDGASTDEENSNNQSSPASPLHHQDELKEAFTFDMREADCKAIELLDAKHLGPHPTGFYKQVTGSNMGLHPGFCKELKASHIGRSDRHLSSNSGHFEFPNDFMRANGKHIQASVKFQGIHDDSPTHVIACQRRRREKRSGVLLLVTDWGKFVRDNGLKKGHKLRFSLVADSFFVVRKV